MYWWKSGQHSCQSSNQVRPVWYLPPWRQNWIKGQDNGSQKLQWCWTNQHRNPPGMADWKRQAASDLDNSCWGLTWHWTLHPCWWYWDCQMSSKTSPKRSKLAHLIIQISITIVNFNILLFSSSLNHTVSHVVNLCVECDIVQLFV